jgi:uncharacterized protein (UPF0333 family)
MKRRGSVALVVALIVLVVLVAAAGIWYYETQVINSSSGNQPIVANPITSEQSTTTEYPYEMLNGNKEFIPWWQPYYTATPSSTATIHGVTIVGSIELAPDRVDAYDVSNLSRPQETYQASAIYCGTYPFSGYTCVTFSNRLSTLGMDIGNKIDSCDMITPNKLLWEDLWGQAAFSKSFSGKTWITTGTFNAYTITPVEYLWKPIVEAPTSSTAIAIQTTPSILPILKNYITATYPEDISQYSSLVQCLANPKSPTGSFGEGVILK